MSKTAQTQQEVSAATRIAATVAINVNHAGTSRYPKFLVPNTHAADCDATARAGV